MPSPTFTLISSVTVGSGGAASIDFTSIPSTYTDLCLKVSLRNTSNNYFMIKFNDATTNFTARVLRGNGSSASSFSESIAALTTDDTSKTSNTFGNADIYIPNYAGSTNKSFSADGVEENNATSAFAELRALLWSNTSAINSIKLFPADYTGTFVQYSTAYLYGIKNS